MSARTCGECTLCCKLLPIAEISKPNNTRCAHQSSKGCAVYRRAGFPLSCRGWSCRWLVDDGEQLLARPDRSRYVVDLVPDFAEAFDNDTGARTVIPLLQVWCDPAHRDAHKDPALRAFIERRAEEEGMATIIRYSATDAFLLFPPALMHDRLWHEHHDGKIKGRTHTPQEIVAALGDSYVLGRLA